LVKSPQITRLPDVLSVEEATIQSNPPNESLELYAQFHRLFDATQEAVYYIPNTYKYNIIIPSL